jgi:hypothetical protein
VLQGLEALGLIRLLAALIWDVDGANCPIFVTNRSAKMVYRQGKEKRVRGF